MTPGCVGYTYNNSTTPKKYILKKSITGTQPSSQYGCFIRNTPPPPPPKIQGSSNSEVDKMQKLWLEDIKKALQGTITQFDKKMDQFGYQIVKKIDNKIQAQLQAQVEKNANNYLSISLDGTNEGNITCHSEDHAIVNCPAWMTQ